MGMKSDMKTRERDREDDVQRRQSVETARRLIHDFGVPLKADRLKTVLGEGSLVPTRVSFSTNHSDNQLTIIFRMPSPRN